MMMLPNSTVDAWWVLNTTAMPYSDGQQQHEQHELVVVDQSEHQQQPEQLQVVQFFVEDQQQQNFILDQQDLLIDHEQVIPQESVVGLQQHYQLQQQLLQQHILTENSQTQQQTQQQQLQQQQHVSIQQHFVEKHQIQQHNLAEQQQQEIFIDNQQQHLISQQYLSETLPNKLEHHIATTAVSDCSEQPEQPLEIERAQSFTGDPNPRRCSDDGDATATDSYYSDDNSVTRLKCGIVYMLLHSGNDNTYGIECSLCSDRPICELHEFAEHMQIWHYNWCDEGQELVHDEEELLLGENEREEDGREEEEEETEEEQEEAAEHFSALMARASVSDDDYAEAQMELENEAICDEPEAYEPFEEVLINNEQDIAAGDGDFSDSDDADDFMQMMPPAPQNNTVTEAAAEKLVEPLINAATLDKRIAEEQRTADQVAAEESNDQVNRQIKEIELDALGSPQTLEQPVSLAAAAATKRQGIGLNACDDDAHTDSRRDADVDAGEPATPLLITEETCGSSSPASTSLSSSLSERTDSFEDLSDWRGRTRSQRRSSNESCLSTRKNVTQEEIGLLIDIYREHPSLWNQSHPQFSVPKVGRHAWLEVTQRWNTKCQRNFTIHDVRTRVSTLCQRYMKERERLEVVGETPRFSHYDRLQFLDEQQKQPIQSKRSYYEKLNTILLEIYQNYPILWHRAQKHLKCPKKREEALRSISAALKAKGIHFSTTMVTQRLRSLHKWYRDEKRRQLACKEAGTTFDTKFKHYDQMHFLQKHTDPYVCDVCGKLYETLPPYREHIYTTKHEELNDGSFDLDGEQRSEGRLEKVKDMVGEEASVGEKASAEKRAMSAERAMSEERAISKEKAVSEQRAMSENKATAEEKAVAVEKSTQEEKDLTEKLEEANRLSDRSVSKDSPVLCGEAYQEDDVGFIDAFLEDLYKEDEFQRQSSENSSATERTTTPESKEPTAKVDCGDFSYELNLSGASVNPTEATAGPEEDIPKNEETFGRLSVEQTRQLIALYGQFPQLWNPRHMGFHNRNIRRVAWRSLTNQINKTYHKRYSWKTMHRKLSDYVKYYKKESQRMLEDNGETKWCFFNDFAFLKDLVRGSVNDQCRIRDKDKNWKIIEVYRQFPQLWNTQHEDFSKRRERQQHFEALARRLRDEHQIDLSTEKIRQRIIDYRCNYRTLKARRMAAEKRKEPFVYDYMFYPVLTFLDEHIAPFTCHPCKSTFSRLSDFRQHNEKRHAAKKKIAAASASSAKDPNNNVCHICAVKFTSHSNLVYHLKRHLGLYSHECSVCHKKFYNSTALRIHESIHTKKYQCVCEECGREFVSMSKLNQHMKRHRNQRDHACDKCEKRFFTAFERDIHLRWHLQIRDKVCNICGKDFVVGSAYYAHMLLHRENKRYSCAPCGIKFAQYAGLYKHRKAHHKT